MLEQGPSKNTNLQEWDKIWALNKKIIDPISPRYTAISTDKICTLTLSNINETKMFTIPLHQQNPQLGDKIQYRSKNVYIEYEDAVTIQKDEKVTLMKWGNAKITEITKKENGGFQLVGEYLEDDKDFKSTKKINWLSEDCCLVKKNKNF